MCTARPLYQPGPRGRQPAAEQREHRLAWLTGGRLYQVEAGGADHGLRVAADADPGRERAGFGMRHHVLVQQGCAGLALPGDRPALEEFGEQRGFLLEEFLIIGEVVAEQRERFNAGSAAEDDFGPATRDRVQRGVPLEHPDRIVGTQHRDGGAETDPFGPGRDRGEYHVTGRHREVLRVMLADPEEVHAGLFGEEALFDYVADRLGVRQRSAIRVAVPVAEGVEPETVCHARLLASSLTARSNSGSVSTAPNTGPPGCSARPARKPSK